MQFHMMMQVCKITNLNPMRFGLIKDRKLIVQINGATQWLPNAFVVQKRRSDGDDLEFRRVSDANEGAGRHGGAEKGPKCRPNQHDVAERMREASVGILSGRGARHRRLRVENHLTFVARG